MPPFLNPLFLAGLAAAALPILIHLFSRRRAREIPFSSLEYLQEISRQKVRRMRLRQWILLALRVAIVALFALAMARPTVEGGAGVVGRGSSTVAVILDNSYSMAAADPRLVEGSLPEDAPAPSAASDEEPGPAPEEGTVYERAKERAEEILQLMTEGDRGVVAFAGRPVTLPFATAVADAGLLRQEIRREALSPSRADLPAAVQQVLPVLASARTVNRELFIISDFQRGDLEEWIRRASGGPSSGLAAALASVSGSSGLPADGMADGDVPGGGADTTGASQGSLGIPENVRVYLVPVRDEALGNLAIERLRFEATAGIGGVDRVVATVVNHGEEPVTEKVIRASAVSDGSPLGDTLFDLAPNGRTDVAIDLADTPDDGAVEVRLGADPLEWDNRSWLVTGDPGVRTVLLVTGDPNEGRFIERALDPEGTAEFFRVRRATPDALVDAAILDADVVMLSDVGRLSETAVENLARFRARGGGILISLGDRVDPRYYNTGVLQKLSSIELLNILQDQGAGTYRSLRPVVSAHAVFAGFPVGPGEDLGSARFRKIMSSRTGNASRVLAEFGRGVPAILEEEGLLVFTSGLEGRWNDFVTSASFPPLLHRMVGYLATRGGGEERSGRVGTALETLVPQESVRGVVSVLDPSSARLPAESIPVDRMARLRSEPTTLPGIYRFVDESGSVLGSFAVNLDPEEADLTLSSRSAKERLFGKSAEVLAAGEGISRELLEGRQGKELWRELLVAVLLLLAVESVLARGRLLG